MVEVKEHLELSDFEGLLNEKFVFGIEGVEQTVEGELVKARPIKSDKAPGFERDPFGLQFRFPPDANIGQCTFLTEHEKIGRIAIFLVPIDNDETELGGRLPINMSGGVLSTNPIGASGMIRFAEAALQVRGMAGEHQVDGARLAMGHAYGGGSQYFSMWVVGSERPA